MLLTGDTGVGKSHLITHYKKRMLASQNYSRECMPVLVSRISSGKGLDATLIQMLADLELFGSSQRKKRGYDTDLTRKLVNSLIKAQVELLIINEFQELIVFKSASGFYSCLSTFSTDIDQFHLVLRGGTIYILPFSSLKRAADSTRG